MTHDQILDDTLKSIFKYLDNRNKLIDGESIIKLILENLMLSAKIELWEEINERS